MPLPLLALAAPSIISGVGSLLGGIFGHKAADKAAQVQAAAGQAAGDSMRAAGQRVVDTTAQVNPSIRTAADDASGRVLQAGTDAGAGVLSSADRANALLDPYSTAGSSAAGTLNAGLAEGGTFNRPFTAADIQMDPGFDFRLAQGQKAQERSAAAHGTSQSGGVMKALARYSQDYSSGEFEKAFARYRQTTQDRYSNLFGVAGLGAQTGTQQGNNLTMAGRYSGDVSVDTNKFAGNLGYDATNRIADNTINATRTAGDFEKSAADYYTGGAAAKAGGIVGGSNALWGGISGAANKFGEALAPKNLLKNPTPAIYNLPQNRYRNLALVPGGTYRG